MPAHQTTIPFLILLALLGACSPVAPAPITSTADPSTAIPPTLAPEADPFFQSQGGGEPRSAGYWLIWNSCMPDNKAEVAAANGGREAGWIILDDLLAAPGVLLGEMSIDSCDLAVGLLQVRDRAGMDQSVDPAYSLAAQLLAAQLNLAAGAEYCPAVDEAVRAGQLLLISRGFDGTGSYFSVVESSQERRAAEFLVEQLGEYNAGNLCR
jgi:hypothetical protein